MHQLVTGLQWAKEVVNDGALADSHLKDLKEIVEAEPGIRTSTAIPTNDFGRVVIELGDRRAEMHFDYDGQRSRCVVDAAKGYIALFQFDKPDVVQNVINALQVGSLLKTGLKPF